MGDPGWLFPREEVQQWAFEFWKKKRKVADTGWLGLDPMENGDQVCFSFFKIGIIELPFFFILKKEWELWEAIDSPL